jgi:5-methyltetrahydrofolate--homocysteine methyltransferase
MMKQKKKSIVQELKERVLVLDGAFGTMIQKLRLSESDYCGKEFQEHGCQLQGNNEILNITQPKVIKEIHQKYIEAGADIITTNTFCGNSISQGDYQTDNWIHDMNVQAVRIAEEAIKTHSRKSNRQIYIAGSIGPTNKSASISPDVADPALRAITFDGLANSYYQQIHALMAGGVDLLLIETVFDTINGKAALFAAEKVFAELQRTVPLMVSATIANESGRLLSGQTIEAFYYSIMHANLLSVGLNCSFGAKQLRRFIEELAAKAECFVSVHPNAGLPNQLGNYDQTPEEMAQLMAEYLTNQLVNIIGGCCGTTPDHIAHLSKLALRFQPRSKPKSIAMTCLSGLEPLVLTKEKNLINIGERTNVAGSKKFLELIRQKNYGQALEIARKQVEGGAQILDICMDDALLDAKQEMVHFLNALAAEPDIAKVPLMIDSSDWQVIAEGLKYIGGKSLVNSISLKEGEDVFIERAKTIRQFGAAVVVMAFDEQGQADTFSRKIEVCRRAYDILVNGLHFPAQDIIFDPNVLTIGTGVEEHNNYAVDFISAVKWIKENLPAAKVSGGISNLSFSFRSNQTVRQAMHAVFLYHAVNAGLDLAIVNPALMEVYSDIQPELLKKVEAVVLNTDPQATDELVSFMEKAAPAAKKDKLQQQWRSYTLNDRISHALIKGYTEFLQADIAEALTIYSQAVDIIDGPLMTGMNTVGELFGSGKMFLPQVVKSARVMKQAVSQLLPEIEKQQAESQSTLKGTIVLATVKGDVHDIGKNILSVILSCNNYQVTDLGVMVPTDQIINQIKNCQPDFLGLSGLITPSLEEMIQVVKELQQAGISIPVLIGGATTSEIHTALKIAPEYQGLVIHIRDASEAVLVMNQLQSLAKKDDFIKKLKLKYKKITADYQKANQPKLVTLRMARKKGLFLDWSSYSPPKVSPEIPLRFDYVPIKDIGEYIDWKQFFAAWKMPGIFPQIFHDTKKGREAVKLFDDAQVMLQQFHQQKLIEARGLIDFFPANSDQDDILIYDKTDTNRIQAVFHCLRNQQIKENESHYLCLADFVAAKNSGKQDLVGLFALSTGFGLDGFKAQMKAANDDYQLIMAQILTDCLAEAFSKYVHKKISSDYLMFSKTDQGSGIRPAIGYPIFPDHTEKQTLFSLLGVTNRIHIELTETAAMIPAASVCGFYIFHPQAHYFSVGKIRKDQLDEYSLRKEVPISQIRKFLAANL